MKKSGAWLSAIAASVAASALAAACHVYVDPPYQAPPPPQPRYQYSYSPPPPQPAPPAPAAPPAPRPPPPRPRPAPPGDEPSSDYEPEPSYADYNNPNYRPPHRHHHPPPDAGAPATAPASSLALTSSPTPASSPAPTPASSPTPAVAACLDTGPSAVGDCSTIKSPPGCSLAPSKKCATFKTYFDPKVAAVAVSCMAGLSASQVCDPAQIVACSKGALVQACTDPQVNQVCQIAATKCKASASDCTVLLSGLNDDGQEKVAQCVAQGCPGGLFACVDGLK